MITVVLAIAVLFSFEDNEHDLLEKRYSIFAEQAKKDIPIGLKELPKKIASLKQQLRAAKNKKGSKDEKAIENTDKRITELQAHLDALRDGKSIYLHTHSIIEKDTFGFLDSSVYVVQVHGKTSFRANFPIMGSSNNQALYVGFDTTGMTDGSHHVLQVPIFLDGSESYDTVNGSQRTLPRIRPLDVERLKGLVLKNDAASKDRNGP